MLLLSSALLVVAVIDLTVGICPARCRCNDDALSASCESANLDFLPIQLNPEVQHINLSDNKITKIDFLHNYNNLVSLDLSFNKIQKLGAGIFEYQRNLKHLNLSNNEIRNISKDSLKGLRALVNLDLSFNNLEEFHKLAFKELHSLRVLKLSNNQITYLETGLFQAAKYLEELWLDNNQLLEVPYAVFADVVVLQYLSLSNNLVDSVGEDQMPNLTDLRTLLLDGNVINEIHPGALSRLISLDALDLSDNNFTAIPTGSLAKLSNLTKLKLSGNFISAVPPVAFRGLFHLRFLHLDRQDVLKSIDSRAFVDNINLERVWLDDNIALENLPTRLFHGNPHVVQVSITNNQLTTLEAAHFPLDQLKYLRLGGNPLECNCSLLWLWRLAQEQNKLKNANHTDSGLTIDSDSIRCAGPEPLHNLLLEQATESQIGCSMSLITTISAIASVCLLLGTASALLYFSPFGRKLRSQRHRRDGRSEKPELPNEIAPCSNGTNLGNMRGMAHHYEDPRINKYMIGPPLIRDYPILSHCNWEKYGPEPVSLPVDMYRQFDASGKARPHIVYV